MTITTTVSRGTLAKYAELAWNFDGDPYVPWGDAFLENVTDTYDGEENIVDTEFLMDELKMLIEKATGMLEDEESWREERMPEKRARIRNFKREVRKFERNAVEVDEWEYDPDEDELVTFVGDRAVALDEDEDED